MHPLKNDELAVELQPAAPRQKRNSPQIARMIDHLGDTIASAHVRVRDPLLLHLQWTKNEPVGFESGNELGISRRTLTNGSNDFGDQDTERRGKGVQPIPRIINKAVPLQEISAAAEGNEVILPGVVRKQSERDRDGERHSHDQPIEVSPLHTAKGGSMSGAGLRLVDVTKNRSQSAF